MAEVIPCKRKSKGTTPLTVAASLLTRTSTTQDQSIFIPRRDTEGMFCTSQLASKERQRMAVKGDDEEKTRQKSKESVSQESIMMIDNVDLSPWSDIALPFSVLLSFAP